MADEVAEALARLEQHSGKRLGDTRGSTARLSALRSPGVDARNDGHGPEPGAERRVGDRVCARTTDNERFAWDSYRRFTQMFGNVVRGIPAAICTRRRSRRPRARAASSSTPTSTSTRSKELTATFKQHLQRAHRRGVPAGSSRAAAPLDPRRVRLVDGRPGDRLPAATTTSRTTGARRSTSSRWCSATRATHPDPASRSHATRSPARPSRAATSCQTPRVRTSSPAPARRATSPR